jgi:adenine deaminase
MDLKRIIRAARGNGTVDLLLTHARIVNVFSGEIVTDHIAVACGHIVGFGEYDAKERIDVGGGDLWHRDLSMPTFTSKVP